MTRWVPDSRHVVLVCGGRNFGNRELLFTELDKLGIDLLITGGAPGADWLAYQWASERGVEGRVFLAEWSKHGPAAGPIRNQRMLDEGKPDLVVGFPGGRGTTDMLRRARAANVRVMEVKP